jgi:hypothetical protein
MNRFITFSIPTYNRGNKLFLLLSILLTEIKNSKYKDEIGVFISNNGSTDNTKEVIINFKKQFIEAGIFFEYDNISINKGMDSNYLNMIKKPKSDYIWFFSDDDILYQNKIDGLIFSIKTHMPSVCNFSFLQYPYTDKRHRYIDFKESNYTDIIQYPKIVSTKITACIIMTKHIKKYTIDDDIVLGSHWAYIPFIFSNLLEDNKLLIYPYIVAGSDEEYTNLRYDPVVFTYLYALIEFIYNKYEKNNEFKQSNIVKPIPLFTDISFLGKFIINEIYLDNDIVTNIKIRIKKSLKNYTVWLNPRLYKHLIKLLICYFQYKIKSK